MEELLKGLKVPFHTPDLLALECAPLHLVMECGQIEPDYPVYCTAYTVEKMTLLIENKSNLAIPVRMPRMHRAHVAGTLYALTTEQVMKLDKDKRNRLWFERKLTSVLVPNGNDPVSLLPKPVWLHMGIPDYWEGQGVEWDRDFYKDKGSYSLARTYVDNNRPVNNHFRFSPLRVEDVDPPKTTFATDEVYKHVTNKNRQEVGFIKQLKRKLFGVPPVPPPTIKGL